VNRFAAPLPLRTRQRRVSGIPGVTHCGSWIPSIPGPEYGWTTRLVCHRAATHDGRHKSLNGWYWHKGEWPPRRSDG
jgi:hypothetical protein